jgi:molybdenum cofactor guanylyltransferase
MVELETHCRGFVLTGGRSGRMGTDKALLPFGDGPLILWMAALVKGVTEDVTLIGSPGKYSYLGLPIEEDVFPGQGPLGGIHAALTHSGAALCLIVGCDMPYLSKEFLSWLVGIAQTSRADAVVAESPAFGFEPLGAVYTPSCLPAMEDALRRGNVKVRDLFQQLRLRVVKREEWLPYDPQGRLFCNLNTIQEYEEARRNLDFRSNIPV